MKNRKEDETMNEYWKCEEEEPERFEKNRLRWILYKDTGKLYLRRSYSGERRQEITIDRRSITPEMIEIFKKFINLCEEERGEDNYDN